MRQFILILLVFFSFSGLAFAQDEDSCYFEVDEEDYIELGDYEFGDCAEVLIEYGYDYEYYEAYGYWGEIYTYVGETGEVYYYDYENEEWVYWGEVAIPDDGDFEDEDDIEDESDVETGSSDSYTLDEIFELAEEDLNYFWASEFEYEDLVFEVPDLVIIESGDVESACGSVGDSTGPVYCGGDHTVYLNLEFMEDHYSRIGDFAAVVVMAHEWGHAVQMQVGYFDEDLHTITTELMADCFAGAYTNYLLSESEIAVLDDGDIDEALTSLYEMGDYEGTPWYDEDAHGTGEQRMDAFQVGMEFGSDQCLV